MKKTSVALFEQDVFLFNSYQDIQKFCKKNNYDITEVEEFQESAIGLSGLLQHEESGHCNFFILVESNDLAVVTHECVHCAMYILHFMGVPYDVNNQEMLAYLVGFLFKEYCSAFKLVDKFQLEH